MSKRKKKEDKLHDGLDAIENQLNHQPNITKQDDGKPIAISHLLITQQTQNDELLTNVKSKRPRITRDDPSIALDKPNYTMDHSDNHIIIDLWDDYVEPEVDPMAKILSKGLWLDTNDTNDICDLLDRLITMELSPCDFCNYGSNSLIVIFMNKFKTNEFIMCKFCKLVAYLSEFNDQKDVVECMSWDNRCMRCFVQCMNQFPKNYNIHKHCFNILNKITVITTNNDRYGADLLFEVYQRNDHYDSLSGLQSVLSAMKEFPSHVSIQSVGCQILWNVGKYKEHRVTIREHGALNIVTNALDCTLCLIHDIDQAKSTMKRLLEDE